MYWCRLIVFGFGCLDLQAVYARVGAEETDAGDGSSKIAATGAKQAMTIYRCCCSCNAAGGGVGEFLYIPPPSVVLDQLVDNRFIEPIGSEQRARVRVRESVLCTENLDVVLRIVQLCVQTPRKGAARGWKNNRSCCRLLCNL